MFSSLFGRRSDARPGPAPEPEPEPFNVSSLTEPLPPPPETETGAGPASTPGGPPDPAKTLELKPLVIEKLMTVFDPEIPVNIYELGLIYDVSIDAEARVTVSMTLTSPACPSAQQLPVEVREKIGSIPGVSRAHVEVVWDPPWSMDKMSDVARLQLGLM